MFAIDANHIRYTWPSGQDHRLAHADFWRLVRRLADEPEPNPQAFAAAAGCPAWAAYLVFRFLVGAGALARVRKQAYQPRPDFKRAAVLAWLGAEDDDLEEGAEDALLAAL